MTDRRPGRPRGACLAFLWAVLLLAPAAEVSAGGEHDPDNHAREADVHAGEAAHDDHAVGGLQLSPAEQQGAEILVLSAGAGELQMRRRVAGEIVPNAERFAHVVPRVAGVVREVHARLGDRVAAGQLLAVLDSQEMAAARAAFAVARQRLVLAETVSAREERLRAEGISSEDEYLNAEQERAQASVEVKATEQRLHALVCVGSREACNTHDTGAPFARHELRAPIPGRLVRMHLVLGEWIAAEEEILTVADLDTVWADFDVFPGDLPFVQEGTTVTISAGPGSPPAEGVVAYLAPLLDRHTRTALARVMLPNPQGYWRPGLFVTGEVRSADSMVPVRIPVEAAQNLDGETVVFVESEDGFISQPVSLGRSDGQHAEVLVGLSPGQRYVARGAFELKAMLITQALDPHAGHGH